MVRAPRFHCRGQRFYPWSGNYDPTCHMAWLDKGMEERQVGAWSHLGSCGPGASDKMTLALDWAQGTQPCPQVPIQQAARSWHSEQQGR